MSMIDTGSRDNSWLKGVSSARAAMVACRSTTSRRDTMSMIGSFGFARYPCEVCCDGPLVVVVEKNMCSTRREHQFCPAKNSWLSRIKVTTRWTTRWILHISREPSCPLLLIVERHTATMPSRSMIKAVHSISQRSAAVLSGSVLHAEG
jgi:hypothetical protein